MKEELINRIKIFAHNGVKLAWSLPNNYPGNNIKGQLIRSSTSVGANYTVASVAQSRKSFSSKLSIVIEEVDESTFLIEFAIDEKLQIENNCCSLLKEAKELTSIFIASRKTLSNSN